ncbi:hypothetical protein J6590_068721 [Homalodisca vitripennis]|nr:hypothetical protein J6590_068721 [Homalodisca vitripennis]
MLLGCRYGKNVVLNRRDVAGVCCRLLQWCGRTAGGSACRLRATCSIYATRKRIRIFGTGTGCGCAGGQQAGLLAGCGLLCPIYVTRKRMRIFGTGTGCGCVGGQQAGLLAGCGLLCSIYVTRKRMRIFVSGSGCGGAGGQQAGLLAGCGLLCSIYVTRKRMRIFGTGTGCGCAGGQQAVVVAAVEREGNRRVCFAGYGPKEENSRRCLRWSGRTTGGSALQATVQEDSRRVCLQAAMREDSRRVCLQAAATLFNVCNPQEDEDICAGYLAKGVVPSSHFTRPLVIYRGPMALSDSIQGH